MPRYFTRASYCSRSGNPAHWSGITDAPDVATAVSKATAEVIRRHPGASRIDIHLSAPSLEHARNPTG